MGKMKAVVLCAEGKKTFAPSSANFCHFKCETTTSSAKPHLYMARTCALLTKIRVLGRGQNELNSLWDKE
jgi:hypothetical protein